MVVVNVPPPSDTRHRSLRRALLDAFPRDARADPVGRGVYSSDASVWQFEPLAVVTPRDEEQVARALSIARDHEAPVLPRGAGTSLAGQTANHAVVLDLSRHFARVCEVHADAHRCVAQPGVVRDELNAQLASLGLEFAPETATSNRATIGGMIGNNSSGMRSVRYGRTIEHVHGARIMLWDGSIIECGPRTREEVARLAAQPTAEGRLWAGLTDLLARYRPLIESRFPRVPRRVGGYSLDEFPEAGPWNLAKLITGAEGTLAVMLDATLGLVPRPRHIGMLAIHYATLDAALRATPELLVHRPLSIELLDGETIRLSRANPSTASLCGFVRGEPGTVLLMELDAPEADALSGAIDAAETAIMRSASAYAVVALRDARSQAEAVELRKKSLGVALSVPGDRKPVSFIEDACVPVAHLADYTRRVLDLCARRGIACVMYGHASVGVLHIKPILNLKDAGDIAAMEAISAETLALVREYGGSWSGEHGDGVARGAGNEAFWGAEMIDVFREVRRLFDPRGMMNPARIVDAPAISTNLRYGPDYRPAPPRTHFAFRDTGGFAHAVELCNGVGACRKTGNGTMCPPYMATRDEEATTRARANALRLAMAGKFGPGGLTSPRVREVLDLCLECKACKTECPSNVDMARLKSEVLAQAHAEHGASWRDRLFAELPRLAPLGSGRLAPLANAVAASALARKFALRPLGIAEGHSLPRLARRRLSDWARGRTRGTDRVVLFADCWSEHFADSPGKWAVRLLERAGFRPIVVGGHCCQRTRISKGFLADAARDGLATLRALAPYAKRGVPILALEPSCQSSLTDDLPDLVTKPRLARGVARHVRSVEDFLAEHLDRLPPTRHPAPRVLLHGHCHQKALYGTDATRALLARAAVAVREVDSGCCGMAGSFGYEAEHAGVSARIGEQRLLPAVRAAGPDAVVAAPGFSCRHQIQHGAATTARHPVEVAARAILGRWHREE